MHRAASLRIHISQPLPVGYAHYYSFIRPTVPGNGASAGTAGHRLQGAVWRYL